MIKLYEITNYPAKSKDEALTFASDYTEFNKEDFTCEVVKEPKKQGLFKWEKGLYNCWYEYHNMDSDKELRVVNAFLYADTKQKRILVLRSGYKSYEIDYSDMTDFEMVIVSNTQTRIISSKNNALKGAILFGTTGAVVGAANSETISRTSEIAELIIRLRFQNKESFEILTCNQKYNTSNKEWRYILDQGKIADAFFRELLEEQ